MATWIIVGSSFVLALILAGAVLLVLLFTRGDNDDDIKFPRFKRITSEQDDTPRPSGDGSAGGL